MYVCACIYAYMHICVRTYIHMQGDWEGDWAQARCEGVIRVSEKDTPPDKNTLGVISLLEKHQITGWRE